MVNKINNFNIIVNTHRLLSVYPGHEGRVGVVAWNNNIISSGSKDCSIISRDIRCNNSLMSVDSITGTNNINNSNLNNSNLNNIKLERENARNDIQNLIAQMNAQANEDRANIENTYAQALADWVAKQK